MRKHAPVLMTEEEANVSAILGPINNTHLRADAARVVAILEALGVLANPQASQSAALASLRRLLGRYTWTRRISPTKEGLRVITRIAEAEDSSNWERHTVQMLLDPLPDLREQPRIRRCGNAECPLWFFASKRIDHKFCGGKCRQHVWDRDPERRAQKNAYMKAQRVQEKARAAKAKEAVGFVKKARVSR